MTKAASYDDRWEVPRKFARNISNGRQGFDINNFSKMFKHIMPTILHVTLDDAELR